MRGEHCFDREGGKQASRIERIRLRTYLKPSTAARHGSYYFVVKKPEEEETPRQIRALQSRTLMSWPGRKKVVGERSSSRREVKKTGGKRITAVLKAESSGRGKKRAGFEGGGREKGKP